MENSLNIAVIGLGFIGLPLSLSYARKGANVVGIDVSETLVKEINEGKSHHLEYFEGKSLAQILQEQIAAGRFTATSSYEDAATSVDNYIITVGIPVKDGDPEMRYLTSACETLAGVLKKGDTIILRSTVIPGTTEELVRPLLEKSGLVAGEDFYLAYASERIAEGRAFEEFIHMPLALGGINEASARRAKDVLAFVTEAEVTISDIKVVETSKVIENVQRDVNIAMVQQFARFAEKAGIDTFELIRVANTHTRVNLLTPGPGVGGYCLPNALYYLLPKAKELGVDLHLLETARQINDSVPKVLVQMAEAELNKQGKTIGDSKVAVLGLAMKDFSNDDRISPPHHLVQLLRETGATVAAYDPAVPSTYEYKVSSLQEAVKDADALIYVTVQEEFLEIDWNQTVAQMKGTPVILDGKNRVPRSVEEKAVLVRI
ncbi:nucleotide sugar dehydrogenase [Aneurinibacillus migulanus]|jgi:UDP-N-acetyl-D-mannosaminuronic acid dehydrogenase|uniref:Capsular biosynthesis protein n=1 Tax=Aneurinibacillus migulanus TaxID=47500 RepID=A0A0D1Y7D8_ANEMI|nr:nucleotide sugar dehydrogenase [Aneurinibacillus migulanus]KIV60368.1 capsular biosynthesis protein [Aneurinibacillus migulanus]KON94993.1 capsular biosynthesis protein [Aneurinibacillus migulanus]MED0895922.1 nucleotide sugar dehydrogenase [Aneurinibacillus migulanus]MED1619616.1 nucleotide sugar dehydrogenase [Aneurinibacillus migulanus]MED4729144.1 nucleotide sugar dehydrogenase [Aneurinibacillus migulanus]